MDEVAIFQDENTPADIELIVFVPLGHHPHECEWEMLGTRFTREHCDFIEDATETMFDDYEIDREEEYKVVIEYVRDSATGPYGQGHYQIKTIEKLPDTSGDK